MIHAIKFERNIFSVKPIQNHSHHINIHISIHNIHSVIENHIVSIVIFAVLVNTHTSSSLFHSSQLAEFSRYDVNFAVTIFDMKYVNITTITANTRLSNNSVDKKFSIRFVFAFDCSSSFAHAENVFCEKSVICKKYDSVIIFNLFIECFYL
jgi:hypothetical protein